MLQIVILYSILDATMVGLKVPFHVQMWVYTYSPLSHRPPPHVIYKK